ncbi:MAG: tyrosine-type recombinase/integrase [bacterium]|nr:tyrosine-type recombinase/integrase [bacterium]
MEKMRRSSKPLPHHLQDFLDWIDVEKGLSAKSQENYARFLKKFFLWLEIKKDSSLKPHELTPDHIWRYRLYLSRECRSPSGTHLKKSTQNYYLIALRILLNFFAHRNIESLPSQKVELAKNKEDRQIRFLTLEQLQRLFDAPDISKLKGLRDRALLETFFSTGMRISEVAALNSEQIKTSGGIDTFELSITGKGGRTRTVYFSRRALDCIEKYLAKRADLDPALFARTDLKNIKKDDDLRLSIRAIEKLFKGYVIATGLPLSSTPHVMRHSFATDLLKQGVDLKVIQDFLGHKHIAATQIYAHVTSKQLKDIHNRMHGKK